DLMLRDSAQLVPGLTFPNRSSICLLILSPAPAPSKTEVVKPLAICNVASAMMHGQMMRVQRQRRAKYSNEAIGITSAGCRFDVKCSSTSPYSVNPKVFHHHGTNN